MTNTNSEEKPTANVLASGRKNGFPYVSVLLSKGLAEFPLSNQLHIAQTKPEDHDWDLPDDKNKEYLLLIESESGQQKIVPSDHSALQWVENLGYDITREDPDSESVTAAIWGYDPQQYKEFLDSRE